MANGQVKYKLYRKGHWGVLEGYDAIKDCRGSRIARDFISKIVYYTTKRSYDFYKYYDKGDYPLRYDERRLNALFAAAIDKVTPCYHSEVSVRRNAVPSDRPATEVLSGPNNSTRADFWCYCRNQNIILEIKRASVSPSNIDSNHRFIKRWSDLDQQLTSIKEDLDKWECSYMRIGVLVLFVYKSNQVRGMSFEEPRNILTKVSNVIEASNISSAWCAAWSPPHGPIKVEYQDDNGEYRQDTCPTVLFFSRIPTIDGAYSSLGPSNIA